MIGQEKNIENFSKQKRILNAMYNHELLNPKLLKMQEKKEIATIT